MLPLTRGSTAIWRSIMAAKARVTASTSALTKLTVTLVRERRARVSGQGASAVVAVWARSVAGASTAVPASAHRAAARVDRESLDGFMLIRSKVSTAHRRACR